MHVCGCPAWPCCRVPCSGLWSVFLSLSLSLLSVVPHLKLCLVCVHEQSVGLWFCFCPSQRVFLWPCLVHIAFQSGCGALANGQGLLASIALVACPVMLIARVLHGLSLGLVLSFSKSLCLSQRVSLSLSLWPCLVHIVFLSAHWPCLVHIAFLSGYGIIKRTADGKLQATALQLLLVLTC